MQYSLNNTEVHLRGAGDVEFRSAVGEHRQLGVGLRSVEMTQEPSDGSPMILRGHAAVFDRTSEDLGGFVERLARGAFRKSLSAQDDVRLLINHDGLPLARTKNDTLQLHEDPQGLNVYAELADTQMARDLRTLILRGDVDQMSFGFTIAADKWDEVDGVPMRTITEIGRLFDVSAVTYPAYPQTDVSMRACEETDPVTTELEHMASDDVEAGEDTETRWAYERERLARATRRLLIARTYIN